MQMSPSFEYCRQRFDKKKIEFVVLWVSCRGCWAWVSELAAVAQKTENEENNKSREANVSGRTTFVAHNDT